MTFQKEVFFPEIAHWLYNYFISIGFSETASKYFNMLSLFIGMLLIISIVDFIIRKILIKAFTAFAKKTTTTFDDFMVTNKVPLNVAHIVPLLLAKEFMPTVLVDFKYVDSLAEKVLHVFSIILTLWIVRSLLNTLKSYFKTLPHLKDKPIDSYIQVFMIFAWVIGLTSALAIVTGFPFIKFITTLGAASAVVILIFKDTILGFVASIQVSINDMVRIGDWITFEKYGADGDVTEINLATVKVRNFDNTTTTIPTYALISDSFKNWRSMVNSDGRRIKRALIIKQKSIKYLTKEDIERLKGIELIAAYLEKRENDIETYNKANNINKELAINGRNLTNIGVFRKYVESYVASHSAINKNMMLMARHLPPTAQGIPLEVYAFSSDRRWENYEYIMADIFDHLLAAVPYFELELFELPDNSVHNTHLSSLH
ncbi:mechanosensitive ion channel family protein [Sediminicola arcticus]|jgi:miniconductance mechanosensitive channel|uniref:Mechanosensitive ion channel domain-containing protein n=1 Tax=Sediminicola arcticus TaxID=1574308 RepID=A0ABV2STI6_9FLAO